MAQNKIGRPQRPIPDEFPDYYRLWKEGKIRTTDVLYDLRLPKSTFYDMVNKYEWEQILIQEQQKKEKMKIFIETAKKVKSESTIVR